MIPLKIVGWGSYLPTTRCPSTELDTRFGKPGGWTEQSYGIRTRHVAGPEETTSMMAAAAAAKALGRAGWRTGEFDVLIGGCGVMEQPIPSTAAIVQDRLGLGRSGIPAFDVNQTCLSFLAALDIAAMGLSIGRWRRALVFSSDIASAGLDPEDTKTSAIFGDGAAAVAIEATPDGNSGLLASRFVTHGAGHALAQLRAGGTRLRVDLGYEALVAGSRFEMDAFGIFKAAARCLPGLIGDVLREAGLTSEDLDLIVCHQASAPGVAHVRRLFAPRSERVVDMFRDTGNQIAASIPTVFSHALETGLAQEGRNVLLLGTAAGISAGAMILRL